jgi:hypothetical protein
MSKTSITIAIFIDSLGWRLASQYDFLRNELPFRGPLATTFGPSSSLVPTILTGVPPREHGHFTAFTYDPAGSPFRKLGWVKGLPDFVADTGRVRSWLGRRLQRQLGLNPEFQLHNTPLGLLPQVDYTERNDLYEPGGILGGQTTLFDDLNEAGIDYRRYEWQPGEDNLEAAGRDLAGGDLQFAYITLSGLDNCLHAHGTASSAVSSKLSSYENQIRDLLNTARERYHDVKIALFSGNGMADVTGQCDLRRQIEALPLEFGKDYFAFYDNTMARFWFLNANAERIIGQALNGSMDGQWLSDHTLRQWGCDFADRRYGHRFFLLRPGVLMNPSFMGRASVAGMHGYDPWHKDSVAFFASNDSRIGRPAGLANLRDLLTASVGVYRLAAKSA